MSIPDPFNAARYEGPPPERLPAPSDPMAVARKVTENYTTGGCLTLRQWRGGWMRWAGTHWGEVEETVVRSGIYGLLEHAEYEDTSGKTSKVKPWEPTRHKVSDVADALTAITHLPEDVDPPAWLDHDDAATPAGELVACENGLLHVGTRELLPLTPRYFNRVAVPFAYDCDAPTPARWLRFLEELWPDDADAVDAVQQWFGYVLSGRTDLHKILLLIGPTRSGKGTIARVLAALVGAGNAAGPTLASLGTNFGLSPLLGKPLAVVSDARLGGANVHQVVERLLSVSGEDMLTVDRKYRQPWTGKLPTRFLVLSNELPRFGDASGAIANRFIVATMQASFLGRENTRLTGELLAELPGILSWALDGLDHLAAGAFTEPASSTDAIVALQRSSGTAASAGSAPWCRWLRCTRRGSPGVTTTVTSRGRRRPSAGTCAPWCPRCAGPDPATVKPGHPSTSGSRSPRTTMRWTATHCGLRCRASSAIAGGSRWTSRGTACGPAPRLGESDGRRSPGPCRARHGRHPRRPRRPRRPRDRRCAPRCRSRVVG